MYYLLLDHLLELKVNQHLIQTGGKRMIILGNDGQHGSTDRGIPMLGDSTDYFMTDWSVLALN